MACVIFDMDGTLVDSSFGLTKSINDTRAYFDLEPLPKEELLRAINDPHVHLPRFFYGVEEYSKEQSRVFERNYFNECTNGLSLYEGIKELLDSLDGRVDLAVATNSYDYFVDKMLEFCGVREYFVKVVGANTFGISKPDPYMLNHILQSLRSQKGVLVGDSEKDRLASIGAGIEFVSVKWGFSQTASKYEARSCKELKEVLLGLI